MRAKRSRVAFAFLLAVLLAVVGNAQTAVLADDEDVQAWNDFQLNVPLSKKVDLYTKFTMRLGRNITRLNDGRHAIGASWKPFPTLTVSPFFWFVKARNAAGRFRTEHRLNIAATFKFPVKRIGLSHRSTYEKRLRASGDSWRYRAMFTIEKNLPGSVIHDAKVFVADEVFYDSNIGRFSRNRFSIGFSKALSKKFAADLYYTRQNDGFSHPGDLNILWFAGKLRL